jgi:hypothetical protein
VIANLRNRTGSPQSRRSFLHSRIITNINSKGFRNNYATLNSVRLIWCSAAGSELNRPVCRATVHNDEENQRGRARFSKVKGWRVFARSSKRPLDRASRIGDPPALPGRQ